MKYFLWVIPKLGILNIFSVFIYKVKCKISYYSYKYPLVPYIEKGPMFINNNIKIRQKISSESIAAITKKAENIIKGSFQYFSNKSYYLGSPPNWFLDPINNKNINNTKIHWSKLNEFSDQVLDIKIIWEPSRFDWAMVLAKAFNITGDSKYIETLNELIKNWQIGNPINQGPNWKCGQEASIRMMQLLLAKYIVNQHKIHSVPFIDFIQEHCERINSTISYAIAQNNNHGTSEAAALYIGGAILIEMSGIEKKLRKKAIRWHNKGKAFLENRVATLILNDGSFSQYSTNYHRLLLDTLNIVEFWRKKLKKSSFSDNYYTKVNLGINWLFQMTNPESGNVPNMGGNDGARLFVTTNTKYRDYRPTIQLSTALFKNNLCYKSGPWDESLYWLNIERPLKNIEINYKSIVNKYGGYTILRSNNSYGIIRFPQFKFRPSNCDALHLDLWHKGINILRDGGSYSYSDIGSFNYFAGNKAHNTVQFNDHNQMPLIKRFLFGEWLNSQFDKQITQLKKIDKWEASYKDFMGCSHKRKISVSSKGDWSINDELWGNSKNYSIRWRLLPGNWRKKNNVFIGDEAKIIVIANDHQVNTQISNGYESLHYFEKTKIPVLEIYGIHLPAKIQTKIIFKD